VLAISRNYELDLALSKDIFIYKASKNLIFFQGGGGGGRPPRPPPGPPLTHLWLGFASPQYGFVRAPGTFSSDLHTSRIFSCSQRVYGNQNRTLVIKPPRVSIVFFSSSSRKIPTFMRLGIGLQTKLSTDENPNRLERTQTCSHTFKNSAEPLPNHKVEVILGQSFD